MDWSVIEGNESSLDHRAFNLTVEVILLKFKLKTSMALIYMFYSEVSVHFAKCNLHLIISQISCVGENFLMALQEVVSLLENKSFFGRINELESII